MNARSKTPRNPCLTILTFVLMLGASLLAGCISHDVAFERANYSVAKAEIASAQPVSLTVVLGPETVGQKYTVHSWMTGIANNWDAAPGEMLRDVVAIEFPQAFGPTHVVSKYPEEASNRSDLTIELTLPKYVFSDFRATVDLRAMIYKPGHQLALDKTYHAEGKTQGGKMFWGGAFAMKSAIRQSSLDAYKQVFAQLRQDISTAFAPTK